MSGSVSSTFPDSRDRTSDAIALVCPVDSALLNGAFENLQRGITSLEKAIKRLGDIVHHLSSTIYLKEAASDVRQSLSQLKAVPLSAFAAVLGTQLVRPSEVDGYPFPDDTRIGDMVNLVDTCIYEDVGSLSSALASTPPALLRLYNVLSGIESYKFFATEYGTLLVLHDKLIILREVIRRFGNQKKLDHYLVASLDSVSSCCIACSDGLQYFLENGIESINTAQARAVALHLNSATVAAFLAGVTATTLQFTYGQNTARLDVATNTLWLSSLALSTGSAMNSFVALAWRQTFFSNPVEALSWWAMLWIRRGYLVLLIASCICFLAGLLCFTFRTQTMTTIWILSALAIIFNLGALAALAWFLQDKLVFIQWFQRGRRGNQTCVTRLHQGCQSWRPRPPRVLLREQSQTLPSIIISDVHWWTQEFIYRLNHPVQRLISTIRGDMGSDLKQYSQSDIESGEARHTFLGFATVAMVAKFCAYFITGRYRVSGRAYRHSRTLRPEPILALEFSPDGKWLASIGENSVRIFSVRRARQVIMEQVFRITPLKDPKIVWSIDNSKTAFSAIGILGNRWDMWDISACDFELNKITGNQVDLGNKHFSSIGQTAWSVTQPGDLRSDISWALHKTKLRITRSRSTDSKRSIPFASITSPQVDCRGLFLDSSRAKCVENRRELTCCGKPTIFIAKFDIGRWNLHSKVVDRTVYALAFYKNTTSKQYISYVPLSGKIRDVAFNQEIQYNNGTQGIQEEHEHEFLVSFASKPPQLWIFKHDSDVGTVYPVRSFATAERRTKKIRGTTWGVSSFAGINSSEVMTIVDDEVQIYKKDTGLLIWSMNVRVASDGCIKHWFKSLEGTSGSTTQGDKYLRNIGTPKIATVITRGQDCVYTASPQELTAPTFLLHERPATTTEARKPSGSEKLCLAILD